MYTYKYPHPAVTADVAAFCIEAEALRILLIRRARDPFQGRWALPGGFVDYDEDLEPAARRELEEETGLRCGHLEQFGAFGRPGRDPRERTVTVAYLAALAPGKTAVQGSDDAADAGWFALEALPELAFDHAEVIACARRKLAIGLHHGPIGFGFLPATFGADALRRVWSIASGAPIDGDVLVRDLLAAGRIAAAGEGMFRASTGS
jgi:8-oxo-dGTP diphosphatase